ncbi:nucleotide disphospho-sugar-binding domain-containing protein [Streptomyces sp. NRRL F-5126]|uniref:nucleotide disphospho-sugar-binding domain-containing protein n=1 Tax=Streptomyces sp. NRRL F-5126 TaxID=1463857 RepID=UPI0004CB33E8|nr:nucleotide disphospho-sugar-binding domain-containing protein [Streptomyces sp. NRRL F-5126]
MRILFTAWAWPSHVFPMVPLAWACQAAGHEVRVASTASIEAAVAHTGLTSVVAGAEPDLPAMSTKGALTSWHTQGRWPSEWTRHFDLLDPGQRGVLDALAAKEIAMAEAMADGLVAFARVWRPDLVVHDAVSYAGAVAASALGVPSASHMWGSVDVMHNERTLEGEPRAELLRLFERFGAEPRIDPDVWLDPCPPRLRIAGGRGRQSIRYVPYNGPGALPDWLIDPAPRRRVCVTWGVTTGRIGLGGPGDLLDEVVEAVGGLDAELVLALAPGQAERLGTLPEGTRVVEGLPLNLLLPSCDAVVHQGGGGTSMTSTAAGVPQLVVSPRPEQMLTGDRLAAVGAGRHLVRGELLREKDPVPVVREAVRALLDDPSYRTRATELRDEVAAMPSPAGVVAVLERLVAERTGATREAAVAR